MLSSYREWAAPAGLAGMVACLWRNETSMPREQRVLPDGCMDLIWCNGAVHVAGPDTRAFLATMKPGEMVTGVRFRPGAAPGVLGTPAYVLRDQRIRLDELWPGTTVTEQIAQAPDPAAALVTAIASRAMEPDRALGAVVARLRAGSGVAATAARWAAPNERCTGDAATHSATVLRRYAAYSGSGWRCDWPDRVCPSRTPRFKRAMPTRRIWPVTCGSWLGCR
jgi:hypothetical protein